METKLIYTGANGNVIDLFNNDYFFVANADGLTGANVALASTTTPNMDGNTVNHIQTQPRGIVFDFQVKQTADVEETKRFILRTIKPKQRGTLQLVQDDRVLEIEVIIEAVEMPRFSEYVTMQVSMHCSEPYWKDAENIILELSRIIDMHYFPVQEGGLAFPVAGVVFGAYDTNMTQVYTNDGDADCGMVITIIALANVTNPTIYKSNGTYIGINDTLTAGDEVIINTNRG